MQLPLSGRATNNTVAYRGSALRPTAVIALLLLTMTVGAEAHTDGGSASGFVNGFTHPLLGPDHIVAMIAVGLWGAILGAPAVWLLPVVFPSVMAFGGALGVLGVPLPGIEAGIAASGIILGLMVLFASRPSLWKAAFLVAIFAIFHGHAHGTELPNSANPLTYSIGFVVSTGLLHLGGIAFGLLSQFPWGLKLVRGCGGLIACVGTGYLLHWL